MTMDTNRSAMKIEWEELFSPETESQVQDMIAARSVPLVREVGAAAEAKPVWYRGQLAQMSLAGLLGGLLAWGLTEFILLAFPDMEVTASNILFTMVLGFGIGLIVALWEGVVTRSWAKARVGSTASGPPMPRGATSSSLPPGTRWPDSWDSRTSRLAIRTSPPCG